MEKEISVRELIDIFRQGWRVILVLTLVMALLGAGYAFAIYVPTYQASCVVDVLPYRVSPYTFETANFAGKGDTRTFGEWCLQRGEQEGLPAEVFDRLHVQEIRNSTLVELQVTYTDPDTASRAANLAGQELLRLVHRQREEELERGVVAAQEALRHADTEINAYREANPGLAGGATGGTAEEPYLRLLEARGDLLFELSQFAGQLEQIRNSDCIDTAPWLFSGKLSEPRVMMNRLVYIVAALILGLLLSSFLVFFKYFWITTGREEQTPR